jgi:uncharacterized membrane protein
MKAVLLFAAAIILIGFASAAYFYPQMPENMISHWGAQGEPNGYMPKAIALFLMPVLSILMIGLFIVIPRIDPMKQNIKKFYGFYEGLIALIVLFLLYIHALTIAWNLGFNFPMMLALPPALGVLFFYIGIMIRHSKRNFSIGIRTPWTLVNDTVWKKTHDLGSKLFKVAGIIAVLSVLVPDYSFWITIGPIIIFTIFIYVYSYWVYRQVGKKPRTKR